MTTFCITLPMECPERTEIARKHFLERGINAHFVNGIHAEKFGVLSFNANNLDHPGKGWLIAMSQVGLFLSHHIVWNICAYLNDSHFMVLEDDAEFPEDWQARTHQALANTPPDFDLLYIGNCNCSDKPQEHIKENIFKVRYPFCTHALIIAKKAIPILLEKTRKVQKIDLALYFDTLPHLKVYTVLPRIVGQRDIELFP